jgi:phosphate/sulfate permease
MIQFLVALFIITFIIAIFDWVFSVAIPIVIVYVLFPIIGFFIVKYLYRFIKYLHNYFFIKSDGSYLSAYTPTNKCNKNTTATVAGMNKIKKEKVIEIEKINNKRQTEEKLLLASKLKKAAKDHIEIKNTEISYYKKNYKVKKTALFKVV